MRALLLQFSSQLHSQTAAPVVVALSSDDVCGKEPLSDFTTTPQVLWDEKSGLTALRFWRDHVCVDSYSVAEGGDTQFQESSRQAIKGAVPADAKYKCMTTTAFLVRSAHDWEALFLSVPRNANLKAIQSMATAKNNIGAVAKSFGRRAGEALGEDSRARPPDREEAKEAPSSGNTNTDRIPGLVYLLFLALILAVCALGVYWGKLRLYFGRAKQAVTTAVEALPKAPRQLVFEPAAGGQESGSNDNPIADVMATFRSANIPEAYITDVSRGAQTLFSQLEKNNDRASIRKVHRYLAEKLADWHKANPEKR